MIGQTACQGKKGVNQEVQSQEVPSQALEMQLQPCPCTPYNLALYV